MKRFVAIFALLCMLMPISEVSAINNTTETCISEAPDRNVPFYIAAQAIRLTWDEINNQLGTDLPLEQAFSTWFSGKLTVEYLGTDSSNPELGVYRVAYGGGIGIVTIGEL